MRASYSMYDGSKESRYGELYKLGLKKIIVPGKAIPVCNSGKQWQGEPVLQKQGYCRIGQADFVDMFIKVGLGIKRAVIGTWASCMVILERMAIFIKRSKEQTCQRQSNVSGYLGFNNIPLFPVDCGFRPTNRLMNATHAQRVRVRKKEIISEGGVHSERTRLRNAELGRYAWLLVNKVLTETKQESIGTCTKSSVH